MAERGVAVYRQYIEAAIGAMLSCGSGEATACSKWVDIAGQYIERAYLESLLDNFSTIEALESALRDFAAEYDTKACGWALAALEAVVGHTPTAEDVAAAVAAGEQAHQALRRITDADGDADKSLAMSVGYGVDSEQEEDVVADFRAVQGL